MTLLQSLYIDIFNSILTRKENMKMKSNELRGGVEAIENECRIEKIAPYYKRDMELVRITNKHGEVTHHLLNKTEELVFIHRSSLETEMRVLVEGLKVVEEAALAIEQFELRSALTAIRQKAEERIDEIFMFVEQEIGDIQIHCVGENKFQGPLRYGQVVGAKLAPPDKFIERPISEVTGAA